MSPRLIVVCEEVAQLTNLVFSQPTQSNSSQLHRQIATLGSTAADPLSGQYVPGQNDVLCESVLEFQADGKISHI